jgi:hypothetical protein
MPKKKKIKKGNPRRQPKRSKPNPQPGPPAYDGEGEIPLGVIGELEQEPDEFNDSEPEETAED